MTQLEKARNGIVTKEMRYVAEKEQIEPEAVREALAKGTAVIPANIIHTHLEPAGIGKGLRTKINANIGTSPNHYNLEEELKKLCVSIKYGADTVMDLSTGGDINKVRREIINHSVVPVGTVPIYQAAIESKKLITEEALFDAIRKHAMDGVDFITVHCGVNRKNIPLIRKRVGGVVSRGGSLILKWMMHNKKENPLYSRFDELLEIAKKYDVTLSLGDGLRPGCLADATDEAQLSELKVLGELTRKAWEHDVQVMVEGPGHLPLNQIQKNVELQKEYCDNAPFYVLGPLVTDVGAGYDHITGAIGGALAASYGADFLCYVTPAEHLRLPTVEDVKEGVISFRIAAHVADIVKGVNGAIEWDIKIAQSRKKLKWGEMFNLMIDEEKATRYRRESKIKGDVCTMCGEYCTMRILKDED
jgi:phosphomethylpyrimidine synthase